MTHHDHHHDDHHHDDHHHHDAAEGRGVVLDIGGEVGAVVVYVADDLGVEELDIRPVGNEAGRFHTGVHQREVGGARVRAAVYPEVRAGTYELLDAGGRPFADVVAVGGEVRTYDLRHS